MAISTYKFPESDKRWHYKIKFDVSLQLDELWVDSQTLDYLNSFRDEIFPSQGFPLSAVPQASQPAARASTNRQATRNQPKRQSKLHVDSSNKSNDTRSTAASH